MDRSILVVDDDETRRQDIVRALSARNVHFLDVADAFGAMAALGRADFAGIVAVEGKRALSLRGLCQLARRRHPEVRITIVPREATDQKVLRELLGVDVDVVSPGLSGSEIAEVAASARAFPTAALATSAWAPSGEALKERREDVTGAGTKELRTRAIPMPVDFLAPPLTDPNVASPSSQEKNTHDENRSANQKREPSVILAPELQDATALHGQSTSPARDVELLPVEPLPTTHIDPISQITRGSFVSALPVGISEPTSNFLPLVSLGAEAPPDSSSSEPFVLEGSIDGGGESGGGPALLMGLFAQELTGRLSISSGPAVGVLYLYRGEPVWADDADGDAGLYRQLVAKGKLPAQLVVDPVPEGQLLGALIEKEHLTAHAVHEFTRSLVRERVAALANALDGKYRFVEDRSFLDVAPLMRLHPFGLVLEARRQSLSPADLLATANRIEGDYLVPQPGLALVADRLVSFVHGAPLIHLIDGTRVVREVWEAAQLDLFMGTLVIVTLRDANLVKLTKEPTLRQGGVVLRARQQQSVDEVGPDIAAADSAEARSSPTPETLINEEILSLYLRLKPLVDPHQVLGIESNATQEEVRAGYFRRIRHFDQLSSLAGTAPALLHSRMEELRHKVAMAFHVLANEPNKTE